MDLLHYVVACSHRSNYDADMGNYGEQIERAVRAQIRAEIAAKGLKQADIARIAGIHTSTLSRLLNDEEDRPLPMKFLAEMATALGLSPHVIAERAERRINDEELEEPSSI